MSMKYLKIYYDWNKVTATLSDAEKGRLITAIVEYASAGRLPKLSGTERHLFPVFQAQIDRDEAEYEEMSEKRSQAGRLGGLAKKANASNAKQMLANASKTYQDKDKDEDKDKEKEKNNPPLPPKGGKEDIFAEYSGEDADLLSALREYEKMRKKIKSPMTDKARKLLIGELEKLAKSGDDRIEVLNQSILNGWKSVYPLQGKKKDDFNPYKGVML